VDLVAEFQGCSEQQLIEAGASRLGLSSSAKILEEL